MCMPEFELEQSAGTYATARHGALSPVSSRFAAWEWFDKTAKKDGPNRWRKDEVLCRALDALPDPPEYLHLVLRNASAVEEVSR